MGGEGVREEEVDQYPIQERKQDSKSLHATEACPIMFCQWWPSDTKAILLLRS